MYRIKRFGSDGCRQREAAKQIASEIDLLDDPSLLNLFITPKSIRLGGRLSDDKSKKVDKVQTLQWIRSRSANSQRRNFGGQANAEPEVDLSLGMARPADESGNDDWEVVQRGNLNPD
jgi:hypothetical protein